MSREIKFRAWDFSDKQMQQVTALYFELYRLREVETLEHKGVYIRNFADPKEITVMQYTGIKDKNGNEIYEGDIVRFQSNWDDHIGVVEFEDCAFFVGRELKGNIGVSWGSSLVDFMSGSGCDGYTVIGNIYENPELLEVE